MGKPTPVPAEPEEKNRLNEAALEFFPQIPRKFYAGSGSSSLSRLLAQAGLESPLGAHIYLNG